MRQACIERNRRVRSVTLGGWLAAFVVLGASFPVTLRAEEEAASRLAILAGKIITVDAADTVINNGVVLIKDGDIEKVGRRSEIEIPSGYKLIDAGDLWLVPGFVDCHNHTAGSGDLNDGVYLSNPGLRTLDTITPDSDNAKLARAGGITTVLLIPGSGNNLSGFGTLLKFGGSSVEEAVLRFPGSLKIAQAGNPERYWYGVGRSFMNYNTRQTLLKARAYHQQWQTYETGDAAEPPEYNPIFHDFRGLFTQEFPTSVHTQIYQVVMTTIDMQAVKLGIKTVLDHSTFDGYKTAPMVVAADMYTINGPRQFHFDRTQRRIFGNAARWWQGGVKKLGINTDAPVVAQEQLPYQAAMACWYGWKPYEAIRGLTRIPAEAMMIDSKVGSIEVGKDADFGLWTGDPIDPRSSCELTVINGRVVYDAKNKRRW